MSGPLAERLAVCSWSLGPAGPDELIGQLEQIGIKRIQLGLDPLRSDAAWADTGSKLASAGIRIASGMFGCEGEDYSTLETIKVTGGIVPDATWETNWANIQATVPIAKGLGISLVSFHAGFLPEEPSDPAYEKLVGRLAQIARAFAAEGIELSFETGQEEAGTLKGFLDRLAQPNVGVNFDPANMILYAKGDPVESVRVLMDYVKGVHIKDATPTETPGEWGAEVPVGTGAVDWAAFLTALNEGGFTGDMAIEREAGDRRVADIRTAKEFVIETIGKAGLS
jgi:L-ribulose-5-phosphate 3-epimerase